MLGCNSVFTSSFAHHSGIKAVNDNSTIHQHYELLDQLVEESIERKSSTIGLVHPYRRDINRRVQNLKDGTGFAHRANFNSDFTVNHHLEDHPQHRQWWKVPEYHKNCQEKYQNFLTNFSTMTPLVWGTLLYFCDVALHERVVRQIDNPNLWVVCSLDFDGSIVNHLWSKEPPINDLTPMSGDSSLFANSKEIKPQVHLTNVFQDEMGMLYNIINTAKNSNNNILYGHHKQLLYGFIGTTIKKLELARTTAIVAESQTLGSKALRDNNHIVPPGHFVDNFYQVIIKDTISFAILEYRMFSYLQQSMLVPRDSYYKNSGFQDIEEEVYHPLKTKIMAVIATILDSNREKSVSVPSEQLLNIIESLTSQVNLEFNQILME